jgi:hypothetical protein
MRIEGKNIVLQLKNLKLKLGGKKWLRKPNIPSVSGVNRDADSR